jgi:DNA-binding transcriptional LysR family regulator
MEYRHLRLFLAVADELHFTRAAARLGIAQPHVSQEIQRLEREIGAQLFVRSRRKVEMTAAGQAFRTGALEVLAATERAVEDARRASRGEAGRLTVGFAGSAGYDVFPEAIRRFRSRWPGIALELREMTTVSQIRGLGERTIDVALGRPRVEPRAEVELAIVRQEETLVALPTSHPLAPRRVIDLHELAQEPWIVFGRTGGPGLYTLFAAACQEAGFEMQVAQEVGEIPTMINLVAGGVGIALVPEPVRRLTRDGVVFRQLEGGGPAVPLGLMWRRGNQDQAVRNFVETLLTVGNE